MKNTKHFSFSTLFLACVVGFVSMGSAVAADSEKGIAKVNGKEISANEFEQVLKANVAKGVADSAELRSAIKAELIAREVMAQEAHQLKVDQDPAVLQQLALQKQTVLSEAVIARHLESIKITDEQMKAEYKRQLDLVGDSDQYQLSQIVVPSEEAAMAVIKSLKNGHRFEELARDQSIDPSRQNGGSLGWVLANQVIAPISNVMVNLTVGQTTAMPIQTQEGWHVLKLEAKRKFKAPAFDEVKEQLVRAILLQERADYIKKLIGAAKIENQG